MKSRVATQKSPVDTAKLLISAVILLAGIGAFYYYGGQPLLYRVVGLLIAVALGVGVAITTDAGRGGWAFLMDSRTEVRKVVWPTRQETMQTTLIVVLMVIVVAIFLWLLDVFLFWGIDKLMHLTGG